MPLGAPLAEILARFGPEPEPLPSGAEALYLPPESAVVVRVG